MHNQSPIVAVLPTSGAQWRSNQIVGHARLAQLDRIVIDECHTILEGNLAFRPKLQELGRLAQHGIQMVYLTATLPIAQEARFFSLIYSTPKTATFFRFPTTRPNIRYSISSFDIQAINDIAITVASTIRQSTNQMLTRYTSTAKAIIYYQTKKATEALAEALGCNTYYSDIGTEDKKARHLRDWISGRYREGAYKNGRVIISTNALGLGIDIPDIRVIIHLEIPHTIRDYGQQSGHTGRDRLPSEALVLRARRQPSDQMTTDGPLNTSYRELLSNTQCRRISLDRGLDRRQDRLGYEEGEEKCNFYQPTAVSNPIHGPQDNYNKEYEDEETRDIRLRQEATTVIRHVISGQARQQKSKFDTFRDTLQRQLQ
ncbi:hypothetical protein FGRMN_11159 [Fusarium graminum]|nr:hypothetical protein FGRMN_11159 [Fusarium graminum]